MKKILVITILVCSSFPLFAYYGDNSIYSNQGRFSVPNLLNDKEYYSLGGDFYLYLNKDIVNSYTLSEGIHYTVDLKDSSDDNGTLKVVVNLTDKGIDFIKENVRVKEVYNQLHGHSVSTVNNDYSIDEFLSLKAPPMTKEQLEDILVSKYKQKIETNINADIQETGTAFKTLQITLDKIYYAFINVLKVKYDAFALGKTTSSTANIDSPISNSDLEVEKILQDGNSKNSASASGRGYLMWILITLLTLEIIVIAITAILKGSIPFEEVIKKFFLCLAIMLFMTNIWNITELCSRVFIKGGNQAAEYTISATGSDQFTLTPGEVFSQYYKAGATITKAEVKLKIAQKDTSSWSIFDSLLKFARWIMFSLTKLIVLIIFLIMALYVMLWQIELRILVIIATFLLPFRIFRFTDFLAKGIPQALLGQCVKLFTATFMIRLSSKILDPILEFLERWVASANWSYNAIIFGYMAGVILLSFVTFYFVLKVSETARALLTGTPTSDGNIQNMATKLATTALTAPLVLSKKNARVAAGATGTALRAGAGVRAGHLEHVSSQGLHRGRDEALRVGGLTGLASYKFLKRLGTLDKWYNKRQGESIPDIKLTGRLPE